MKFKYLTVSCWERISRTSASRAPASCPTAALLVLLSPWAAKLANARAAYNNNYKIRNCIWSLNIFVKFLIHRMFWKELESVKRFGICRNWILLRVCRHKWNGIREREEGRPMKWDSNVKRVFESFFKQGEVNKLGCKI